MLGNKVEQNFVLFYPLSVNKALLYLLAKQACSW